jgi:hypothetical protein
MNTTKIGDNGWKQAPRQGDFTDNSNIFRMKCKKNYYGEEDNKTYICAFK